MTDPKPISVEYVDPSDYAGPAPQPFVIVGEPAENELGPIAIDDVTGLQGALDDKADSSHTHTVGQVTGLQGALDGKAASTHTHTIAQITGLQGIIDDLTGRIEGLEGAA